MTNPKADEEFQRSLKQRNYEIIKSLGRGKFGEIYLVFSNKYKTQFVVKRVKESPLTNNEIKIMKSLNNPYVVHIYDYWTELGYTYIIMNYLSKGSFSDYWESHTAMSKKSFVKWSQQIITALDYCHVQGISHCDLKPSNILIDQYDRAVLIDFGLGQASKNMSSSVTGTLMTMAPEVLSGMAYDPQKADIWSLGITFLMIATGEKPYEFSNIVDAKTTICGDSLIIPLSLDREIRQVICNMCKFKPEERCPLRDLLKLPLYQNYNSPKKLIRDSKSCKGMPRGPLSIAGKSVIDNRGRSITSASAFITTVRSQKFFK